MRQSDIWEPLTEGETKACQETVYKSRLERGDGSEMAEGD